MKLVTAFGEAILICLLFALFTVPFLVLNHLSASQIVSQTIAQTTNR